MIILLFVCVLLNRSRFEEIHSVLYKNNNILNCLILFYYCSWDERSSLIRQTLFVHEPSYPHKFIVIYDDGIIWNEKCCGWNYVNYLYSVVNTEFSDYTAGKNFGSNYRLVLNNVFIICLNMIFRNPVNLV